MGTLYKFFYVFGLCLGLFLFAGCSQLVIQNTRSVSIEEIIKMSQAGVDKDVIMREIEVTHSKFKLDPDEIINLTETGVDDEIIELMIDTVASPGPYDWEQNYYPGDNWISSYNYYGYRYMYPYFPGYYPSPYIVYREPGLVGNFYRYVPLGRNYWPYYERSERRMRGNYNRNDE
ncbi:MAG: hypothetical protein JXB48_05380 [Candidatus Latescibacteria bacterium]|nr:hypothetical protein [Candidatus Latescibacterota bacterium]